jgi:hypothetical protein
MPLNFKSIVQKLMDAVAEKFNCVLSYLFQNFSNKIKINVHVPTKAVTELILHAINFNVCIVTSLKQWFKLKKHKWTEREVFCSMMLSTAKAI